MLETGTLLPTNEFLRLFTPQFNVWYVVLPVLFIIQMILAFANVHVRTIKTRNGEYRKVTTYWNYRFTVLLAAVSTVIVSILMLLESWLGAAQFLLNRWGYDSDPAYAFIGAMFGIAFVGICYGFGCYVAADKLQQFKKSRLQTEEENKRDFEKSLMSNMRI